MVKHFLDEESFFVYKKDLEKSKPLSREEEKRLVILAQSGNLEAREKLVIANLRFVVSIANKYKNNGLSFADLIAEGNIGLLLAIEKFDVTRGYKLISYAVWWIRQAILKVLYEKVRVIRIPISTNKKIQEIRTTSITLEQAKERFPTISEIAKELNIDILEINASLLEEENKNELFLSGEMFTNDSSEPFDFLERLEYTDSLSDEIVIKKEENEILEMILKTLNDRERAVITMYFGLDNEGQFTLEQIGRCLDVSRERARQIKEKALNKIFRALSKRNFEYTS